MSKFINEHKDIMRLSKLKCSISNIKYVHVIVVGVFEDLKTQGDINNNYRGAAKVIIDITEGF